MLCCFFFPKKKEVIIITTDEKENVSQSKLRKMPIDNDNPFLKASQKGDKIIKQSPGSPIYYKDFSNGVYAIAIINEFFEFQYFDKNTMRFLVDMVNKGRQFREKINNNNDIITQLNLECQNLSSLDIKYLTTFDLKNLIILDINSNSIN